MSGPIFPHGPLRQIFAVLTVVTIVAFATVGYSVYQVIVTNSGSSPVSSESAQLVNGTLLFSANGSLPNSGLYPIQYSIYVNASTPMGSLANATSAVQSIAPGQTRELNISFDVDLFGSGGPAASALFYNGSNIQLNEGVRVGFSPFLTLRVSKNTTTSIQPFLGGLSVTKQSGSSQETTFSVSFTDDQPVPIGYQVYGVLQSGANSTVSAGTAMPGTESSAVLTFAGVSGGTGPYAMTLHTIALGHDFTIQVEVPSG